MLILYVCMELQSDTHTYTNWGTVRLVWDWLKLSRARAKDKRTWASMKPLFKRCRLTEDYERLASIQRREQGRTLRRYTYTDEIRTHNIYTNIPTHVHRELGWSKCRLNVLKDSAFAIFSKRQAVALSAPFMCGWFWISSTGVTGHKHAIHSYDQTIKLTVKMI